MNIAVLVVLIGITETVLPANFRELDFTVIKNFLIAVKDLCIAAAFIFMILSVAIKESKSIQRRAGNEVYK